MEIEKLIEHMRQEAKDYRSGRTLGRAFADAEDVLDEAASALEQLQAENEKLKAQVPRWIPVEERLPEKHSEYIVCACDEGEPIDERIWGDTVVVCADYYDGAFTWSEGNTEYDISDIVTHWMPLPEAPKEGNQ